MSLRNVKLYFVIIVTAEKWFGTGLPTLVRAGVNWLILGAAQLNSGVIRRLNLPYVRNVPTDPPLVLAQARSVDSQVSFVWGDLSVQCLSLLHVLTCGSVLGQSILSSEFLGLESGKVIMEIRAEARYVVPLPHRG